MGCSNLGSSCVQSDRGQAWTPRRDFAVSKSVAQPVTVGSGMPVAELERVWRRLRPLAIDKMPLSVPPPRNSRFGSPLVLSRIHWVRPEMVVEVSYAEWTPDGLLRHVVYLGEREDKLASNVRRDRASAENIVQTQRHIRG